LTSSETRNFKPSELISPCGMNCATCIAYFGYTMNGKKRKHTCLGCRLIDKKCAFIKKNCAKLSKKQIEFCFECSSFPCKDLDKLDKRHREDYGHSLIENLKQIQQNGLEAFLEKEQEKWKCATCGGTVCVHNKKCYKCNSKKV
jgi:hypothetical protein